MSEKTTASEQIIQRIKKLLKHAESAKALGSEAEAEAFALKANELLMEYNLSMLDIAASKDDDAVDFSNYVYGEYISYKDNQSGNRWKYDLISVLTKYNLCDFTFNRYHVAFRVYGRMENVDVVVWMYNFLSIGLLRLAQERYNTDMLLRSQYTNRYAFLKDFLLGAVRGVQAKLEEQRQTQAKNSQMYGLMVINKEMLDKYIKTEDPNIKEARARKTVFVGAAYSEGKKAGFGYNITKPLSSPKQHKQLN